ncbi:lysylphosphatidylglycerol synthase transmembrane domain-containing protein [Conexibacter sp. JD483]|uniref:lysylphosphatidylglycerol synthase transmembrane domain-containing protein n=1 Tax=unclassified Conexibacter TaxID=2627773 RepID=UPI002717DC48|nr:MULTISPECIES: lysylphosphatidylglycerol synthase transmembrane domain-containing protein [unclassified Conexibacter]MDO8187144.1 lysylphosphatidylglycerol synthase transmembrane domain-containing protein [Conexibacter sp. CPCC 205706]MDO8200320.1 lysylphosphatidylglycerol synthase transmembrane domain-containing protein [Conexibacter sp. CPCC 205762]MDR9368884.1 lysylphosphatidylglycerol synthase transmembrane domain-containing protein [Conexibacter sp. JD483]
MTARHQRPHPHLGDRLEKAIEDRVELTGEFEMVSSPDEEAGRRRKLVQTGIWLFVTGISLYLVAPSLLDTLGSWRDVRRFEWQWLLAMLVLQGCSLGCLWFLQQLALRPVPIAPVITSQLAGNALAKIAPGGGALGAALQYRMLVQAGVGREKAVGGIAVVNVFTFAMVLALPVLTIPTLLRGGVDQNLVEVAALGIAVFVVLAIVGSVMLARDSLLIWVGRTIQRIRNRMRRRSPPVRSLPTRLLRERDRILATFGPRWKRALAATVGRWAFDYLTLLAALAAVHASPSPGLVLLAFCAAQVLTQIPLTPGGLGFVEAGLTGMLTLAGVSAGNAVLATFAYRLFSYWLPLPLGLVGMLGHRRVIARMDRSGPSSPSPSAGPPAG